MVHSTNDLHANKGNIMLCESSNTVNSTESDLTYGFLKDDTDALAWFHKK